MIVEIQQQAVSQLLQLLPDKVSSFQGSEFPLPVKATFLGDKEIDIPSLRQELIDKQNSDVKELLEPVLLAAELYEAACDDKQQFFLDDQKVQRYVFMGSKWQAGWALVLGGNNQDELIGQLKDRNFAIFTDLPNIPDTVYIGNRPTSAVYFLQLMVRYGLIWGRIPPGNDHQMGHFLEKDVPGLIIVYKDLPALKYLVVLGLMKLGAPAVVPPTFPFPYGCHAIAETVSDIVETGSRFPNLRQRYYKDQTISLPDYCNPASVKEEIQAAQFFGGKANSFFCLRPAAKAGQRLTVIGKPAKDIGILVEIAAQNFSDDIAATVETAALKSINFLSGVHAYNKEGIFHLELKAGISLNEEQISNAIYWGIRYEYPRLENIAVTIFYEPAELALAAKDITQYKKQRRQFIENMTEDNTEEFCVCTECRPFSLVHTCILTPERMPMCAARTYASVKAAALLGSSTVPWKRRSEKDMPLRRIFNKGKVLDADKGEYQGCNQIYQEMTDGQLNRVYLHSLRDYPTTSCGCFQALAFWLEEVQGIGIMSRNSQAVTPTGQTWPMLANKAGGKQCPGIAGVSLSYIRSRHFLKGDGGIGNVVWVDSKLYKKISDLFLPGKKVATEKELRTIGELKNLLIEDGNVMDVSVEILE